MDSTPNARGRRGSSGPSTGRRRPNRIPPNAAAARPDGWRRSANGLLRGEGDHHAAAPRVGPGYPIAVMRGASTDGSLAVQAVAFPAPCGRSIRPAADEVRMGGVIRKAAGRTTLLAPSSAAPAAAGGAGAHAVQGARKSNSSVWDKLTRITARFFPVSFFAEPRSRCLEEVVVVPDWSKLPKGRPDVRAPFRRSLSVWRSSRPSSPCRPCRPCHRACRQPRPASPVYRR